MRLQKKPKFKYNNSFNDNGIENDADQKERQRLVNIQCVGQRRIKGKKLYMRLATVAEQMADRIAKELAGIPLISVDYTDEKSVARRDKQLEQWERLLHLVNELMRLCSLEEKKQKRLNKKVRTERALSGEISDFREDTQHELQEQMLENIRKMNGTEQKRKN